MGLDYVELLLDAEERFGVDFFDEDAERIRTAGDLHECSRPRAESGGGDGGSLDAVREVISRYTRAAPGSIEHDSRLREDLGID